MRYCVSKMDGSVAVLFCERLQRFLPMEEHLACEFAVAPVFDENHDPVSIICMYREERCSFQPFEDIADGGRGEAG